MFNVYNDVVCHFNLLMGLLLGSGTPVFHRLFLPETVQAEIVGDADAERKFIKCRHSVILVYESEMVG